jgi:hypothetical protein
MARVVARLHGKTKGGGGRKQRSVDDKRDEGDDGNYDDRVVHMIVLRQSEISMTMTWRGPPDRPASIQRSQRAWKVAAPTWKWTAQSFLATTTRMITKFLTASIVTRSVLRPQPTSSSERNRKWLITGQIEPLLALRRERLPRRLYPSQQLTPHRIWRWSCSVSLTAWSEMRRKERRTLSGEIEGQKAPPLNVPYLVDEA